LNKFLPAFYLILLCACSSWAQNKPARNSPRDFGFTVFSIKGSADSIHFVVSDTLLNRKKPVVVFCQGSLPTALFWKEDSTHTWEQMLPFNYKKYLNNYNFVIISKPAIPVFTYTANQNYFYIDPKTKTIPQEYYDKSYLDYYTTQANDVIAYLVKQKWVDASKIVLFGHSQGSKVVAKTGATNKHITHAVFLAGNPLGRIDQDIRLYRKQALLGQISATQAQQNINEIYSRWQAINTNKDDTHSGGGDTNKAWASFSEPLTPYLLNIKVPLFIGYGTADNTADYCDLLPLDFIKHHKTNYTMKPYLDYDHNFRKLIQGKPVDPEGTDHWDEVAANIFEWLQNH
jgi:pimeloyl-ACP methyl ester carboxylesterase